MTNESSDFLANLSSRANAMDLRPSRLRDARFALMRKVIPAVLQNGAYWDDPDETDQQEAEEWNRSVDHAKEAFASFLADLRWYRAENARLRARLQKHNRNAG